MKVIPQNILEVFPNAKYVESTDWQVEDDTIELTSRLHIQVRLQDDYYSLIKEDDKDGFIFHYLMVDRDLNEVYKKAIETATGTTLN